MKTIVGFGASTMAGAGDSQGGFFRRLEQQGAPATRFINHGVGGNTTRDMLSRTAAVQSIPTYDLIVLLGCNDLPRANDAAPAKRTSLAEYSGNLQTILGQIRGQRSLFISSFLVSEKLTGVKKATFDNYMTAALQIAGAKGYEIWDLYHAGQAEVAQYWAADGVHFNDAGHELIAQGVRRWLANVTCQSREQP